MAEDLSELIFRNPNEALRRHAAEIETRLTQKYQQEQGQQAFWNQFYADNPDLRPSHAFTQQALTENYEQLKGLSVSAAAAHLGELTRDKIKRYERTKQRQQEAAVMQGGPGFSGMSPAALGEDDQPTLGETIAARKKARQAAGTFMPSE